MQEEQIDKQTIVNLECIREAVKTYPHTDKGKSVVELANEIYDFVKQKSCTCKGECKCQK